MFLEGKGIGFMGKKLFLTIICQCDKVSVPMCQIKIVLELTFFDNIPSIWQSVSMWCVKVSMCQYILPYHLDNWAYAICCHWVTCYNFDIYH